MGNEILVLNGWCTDFIKDAGYEATYYDLPRILADFDEELNTVLKAIEKDTVRGVVLIGGEDIDRTIYWNPEFKVVTLSDALRLLNERGGYNRQDMLELAVAKFSPKPVFGYCRGFQELHVALSNEGWSPLAEHLSEHFRISRHGALFVKDAEELGFRKGDVYAVNSLHHQGVYYIEGKTEKIHPRMNVLAVSDTEIPTVEIATWTNFAGSRALGVQYHPEMMRRAVDLNLLKQVFG